MRLRNRREYDNVFQRAIRSASGNFTVLARSNGGCEARLGLAIARKHARKAVARNRIKRVVRESFRVHRWSIRGLDVVVLARPGTSGSDNRSLAAALVDHWQDLRERKVRGLG